MLTLSFVYLFPEAVFNAELVAIAGGRDSSEFDRHSIELFGRAISGIGVTLLLADLLVNGRILKSKRKTFLVFSVIALFVWPTVYFGQKWVIDEYIIHPSTPEQRQQAYYSQIIRSALIRNAVELEGVPYDPKAEHSASEMTFLALFPGLVYANDRMMQDVDRYQSSIVRRYVSNRAMQDFEENFSAYKTLSDQIWNSFKKYEQGSNEYNTALNSTQARADKIRSQIETDVAAGWDRYQSQVSDFNRKVESEATKIAPKIYDYFSRRNKCRSQSCRDNLDKRYDKSIQSLGSGYIEPRYWLIAHKEEKRGVVETLFRAAITGGVSLPGDLLAPDPEVEYRFTNSVAHYQKRLRPKLEPKFTQASGGYPLGVASLADFRKHPETAARVRANLKSQGLALPSSWQLADRGQFYKAVANRVKREADSQWTKTIKRQGFDARPNMDWNAFQRSSGVQKRIKAEMGQAAYVNPMLMTWNNRAFMQRVVQPSIDRESARLMRELDAQLAEFSDGGSLETKSKNALRATIIPPISMTLSLFLVVLTAVKLPLKVALLIVGHQRKLPAYVAPSLTAISVSLIALLPFVVSDNRYTQSESTVNYFLAEVSQSASPMIGRSLEWVLLTQPSIQPMGQALEQKLGVAAYFKKNNEFFEQLDKAVLGRKKQSAVRQSSARTVGKPTINESGLLPLTINTNVAGARVRVMNIGPKYQRGILLAPGKYDIEVSAPNYRTQREWIQLDSRHTEFDFRLNLK